jgi:hypothetical protein
MNACIYEASTTTKSIAIAEREARYENKLHKQYISIMYVYQNMYIRINILAKSGTFVQSKLCIKNVHKSCISIFIKI